jgi:hypothetical protein
MGTRVILGSQHFISFQLLSIKGGFPLGQIFRPNRNFLLSYKHSDETKQKSFGFEQ